MNIFSPSQVTSRNSVLVDFRDIIRTFSPLTYPQYYLYQNSKHLSTVMNEVTVERVIELVLMCPSDGLNFHDVILMEYIEQHCDQTLMLFQNSWELIENFNLLVEMIVYESDNLLRHKFAHHLPSEDYGRYVFEAWIDSTTALMIPVT